METILNKQKILQEFIPQPVIVFNTELLEMLLDDFINNEIISHSRQEIRSSNYTRTFDFSIDRGGVKRILNIDYKYDFSIDKEYVNWVTINDIQIRCFIEEGRHEGEEVEVTTPYWTSEDATELEQSITKYYNS